MPPTDTTSRWGRIPAWWLDRPDLDADGFAILSALSTFADEQGVCWPSQATLAAKLKRSRPTVNRILQKLHDIGLVTIERRRGTDGARLSCRYRLCLVPGDSRTGHSRIDQAHPADVPLRDRDDSPADAPCPATSQEHLQSEQIPDSPGAPAPAKPAQTPVQEVPQNWYPSPEDVTWARNRFGDLDLDRHAEIFVLRCRAHGYRYRDIAAAWRSWLLEDTVPSRRQERETGRPATAARETAAERRLDAWMAVAARLQGFPPPATRDSLT